jgi:dienelactone hydrolase
LKVEPIRYAAGDRHFSGALVYDPAAAKSQPLLLMAPNWLGAGAAAMERGSLLASRGYVVFVVDMYGEGVRPAGPEQAAPLADALRANPDEQRRRINAALASFRAEAAKRGIGDASRQAAIGFCFGGGNVLELARSGAALKAVVSVHGDLTSLKPAKAGDIKAALLVLHGSTDRVSPKSQRDGFEDEMTTAGVTWRMLVFGGVIHAYTDVGANVPGIARYDEPASRASYEVADAFIADSFANRL